MDGFSDEESTGYWRFAVRPLRQQISINDWYRIAF
jgi:hypothetical protein